MRRAGIVVVVVALLVVGFAAARIAGPDGGAATPSPVAAAPTATPSSAAPSEPTPILDGSIAQVGGWTSLGRMTWDGADASGGTATLSGTMPVGWVALMVSVACAGQGTIRVGSAEDTRDVDCPVSTGAPRREAFFSDVPSYRVTVTRAGQVAYEVLVDGARSVLNRPPVLIAGAGKPARMIEGCGISLQLAWGYDASDDCATNIPGEPIPTVAARKGRVDIRIPGWTIVDAKVRCGRIGPNDIPELIELRGCRPHARVVGSTATISGLPSGGGRRLLEFGLSARNAAGDEFSVPYFAWVRP